MSFKLISLVWVSGLLFASPYVYLSGLEIYQNETNITDSYERKTCTLWLPENQLIPTDILFVICGILISFLIPILLISVFYMKILKQLNKQTKRMKRKFSAHRKITILVLIIIGVYVFSISPFWINQIILIINYSLFEHQSHNFYKITSHLSFIFQILISVNSALNPYLYAFLSETFRKSFINFFNSSRKCLKCPRIRGSSKRIKIFRSNGLNSNCIN